ncbi:major capsid protein P2 [Cognatiyoonia sp. IB215182]|uniref:major capsid protein P2 n=1 Tax=Cognatiyoonia sp. IB215182 TaxID=3097353 RepID=UPI002A0AB58C|nr:major capsid protein P2 [Cognatiyoonia sp. IB215182]MDX8353667.1 major capsid protein P2 [Cognatiyoonia sp. IB215182]
MVYRLNKLPTPQVGAGQTATCRIPLGPTYTALMLEVKSGPTRQPVSANNLDNGIGEIRLIVDGDTKMRGDASFFRKRAAFYGIPWVPGCLPLLLTSPWARTRGGEDSTGYGTFGGSMANFTLEVDFEDVLNQPRLEIYARQSDPRPFGTHLRIQPYADDFGFTGQHEMVGVPALGPHRLLALDIDNADIGEVEVLANNVRQYISTPIIREQQLRTSGRTPQDGFTHIDFIGEQRMDEAMPLKLTDFRVKADFLAAPNAFKIYATTIQDDNIA